MVRWKGVVLCGGVEGDTDETAEDQILLPLEAGMVPLLPWRRLWWFKQAEGCGANENAPGGRATRHSVRLRLGGGPMVLVVGGVVVPGADRKMAPAARHRRLPQHSTSASSRKETSEQLSSG